VLTGINNGTFLSHVTGQSASFDVADRKHDAFSYNSHGKPCSPYLCACPDATELHVGTHTHTYLAELSIMTEGLTGGGGTGKAVMTIQSGRTHLVLKPSAWQSSSEMRRRMSYARAAVSSCSACVCVCVCVWVCVSAVRACVFLCVLACVC